MKNRTSDGNLQKSEISHIGSCRAHCGCVYRHPFLPHQMSLLLLSRRIRQIHGGDGPLSGGAVLGRSRKPWALNIAAGMGSVAESRSTSEAERLPPWSAWTAGRQAAFPVITDPLSICRELRRVLLWKREAAGYRHAGRSCKAIRALRRGPGQHQSAVHARQHPRARSGRSHTVPGIPCGALDTAARRAGGPSRQYRS